MQKDKVEYDWSHKTDGNPVLKLQKAGLSHVYRGACDAPGVLPHLPISCNGLTSPVAWGDGRMLSSLLVGGLPLNDDPTSADTQRGTGPLPRAEIVELVPMYRCERIFMNHSVSGYGSCRDMMEQELERAASLGIATSVTLPRKYKGDSSQPCPDSALNRKCCCSIKAIHQEAHI
ncbi:hypothetical protein Bbelb_280790 [Branchiostoma belcheri]|nr:hypothetical protein Bbelb_280790 [Branchiostoma belcheri]